MLLGIDTVTVFLADLAVATSPSPFVESDSLSIGIDPLLDRAKLFQCRIHASPQRILYPVDLIAYYGFECNHHIVSSGAVVMVNLVMAPCAAD